jgi:hypothetical protein
MSCTEFEANVTDLADDRLMDALTRRRLQRHADECASCAQLLAAERRLSARLDLLAEETENQSASPALKADLLATFASLHTPERNFVVHTSPQRAFPYWQLAAAAVVILTLVCVALVMRKSTTPTELTQIAATPSVSASPVTPPAASSLGTEQTLAGVSKVWRTRSITRANRVRAIPVKNNEREVAALTQETTTEYLPLTYMSDQTALQTGVVVRVEIPRATLLSMGLPMNSDRGNTLVKADVVVGDDGVPRAIRLVQ